MIVFIGLNRDFMKVRPTLGGYILQDKTLLHPVDTTAIDNLNTYLLPLSKNNIVKKYVIDKQVITIPDIIISKYDIDNKTAIIQAGDKISIVLDVGIVFNTEMKNLSIYHPLTGKSFIEYTTFSDINSLLSCSFLGQDWERGYKFRIVAKNEKLFYQIDAIIDVNQVWEKWEKQKAKNIYATDGIMNFI